MWLSFERTRFHTLTGNFRLRHSFHSRYLTAARDIIVCLRPITTPTPPSLSRALSGQAMRTVSFSCYITPHESTPFTPSSTRGIRKQPVLSFATL